MAAYRAYQLNPAGRITGADWLEADSDAEAETLAFGLCRAGTPTVEVWLGARCVAILSCDPPDAGALA